VKILGICASHRKGWNTEYALVKALKAAEDMGKGRWSTIFQQRCAAH
jgi:multimeric flavodoxin WrbA